MICCNPWFLLHGLCFVFGSCVFVVICRMLIFAIYVLFVIFSWCVKCSRRRFGRVRRIVGALAQQPAGVRCCQRIHNLRTSTHSTWPLRWSCIYTPTFWVYEVALILWILVALISTTLSLFLSCCAMLTSFVVYVWFVRVWHALCFHVRHVLCL